MYSCPPHQAVTRPPGWLPPAPIDVDDLYEAATGIRIVHVEPPRGSNGWVTLTPLEVAMVKRHAREVWEEDHRNKRSHGFELRDETELQVKERGFGAEMAASIALGLPLQWELITSGYVGAKRPDLGKRIEVKNARFPGAMHVAQKRNPPEFVYLHVIGSLPRYHLRGWIEGRDLMIPANLGTGTQSGQPTYTIDERELNPLPLPEDA